MKPFIMLIGNSHSGKSTIISSLTGYKYKRLRHFVEDKSTGQKISVIINSPQESVVNVARFKELLQNTFDQADYIGLVIAIQPNFPTKRLSLEEIIFIANDTGDWEFNAFILNPPYNGDQFDSTEIETRLEFVDVNYHTLNAQQFAFLNAEQIKNITNIYD